MFNVVLLMNCDYVSGKKKKKIKTYKKGGFKNFIRQFWLINLNYFLIPIAYKYNYSVLYT